MHDAHAYTHACLHACVPACLPSCIHAQFNMNAHIAPHFASWAPIGSCGVGALFACQEDVDARQLSARLPPELKSGKLKAAPGKQWRKIVT